MTKEQEYVYRWQNRLLGDFDTALFETIALADNWNKARLQLVFPDEVGGYLKYTRVDGWWEEAKRAVEADKFGLSLAAERIKEAEKGK